MPALLCRFLLLLSLFIGLAPPLSAAEAPPLSFGVVPQQAAAKLARGWLPITKWLSERTGRRVLFRTAPDIPTFERRLAAGEYDIAYMNPYHYTVYSRAPGYRAIARQRDKRIRGILVVHRDSGIESLAELEGQVLAFPAPAAFAATLLTRAALERRGIDYGARYVTSHDTVYRTVEAGLLPAGGGVRRTLAAMDPEVASQLRVLWESDGYTPHAIALHPRLDPPTAERLLDALLALDRQPAGRPLLEAIRFKGVMSARDADWDDVRALGITLLEP